MLDTQHLIHGPLQLGDADLPMKFNLNARRGPAAEDFFVPSHPLSTRSCNEFCNFPSLGCRVWSSALPPGPVVIKVVFSENEKFVGQPRED
ncbi:hypothetical protein VTL71DRAFT_9377 [Oculimacula yallundae]|uniref:Uncharacterized protein n=1 Tax=Oculimacula yallundae TaxID=86028 RepID=A0ABR4BUE6_9HELO